MDARGQLVLLHGAAQVVDHFVEEAVVGVGLRAQGTTEAPTTAALAAFLRGFAPEQRPTHVIPAFVM